MTDEKSTAKFEEEGFVVRFQNNKDLYQKIADKFGYESYSVAVRNAAKVGAAMFAQDQDQFLALLNQ